MKEWVPGPVNRSAPYPPPQEIVLNASVTDFTRREDGGMELHFTPVRQVGPEQYEYDTPCYTVVIDAENWARFKARAVADGEDPSARLRAVRSRLIRPNDFRPLQ